MTRRLLLTFCLILGSASGGSAQVCAGDCDGDGNVTVDQLVVLVNIALEAASVSRCMAGDADADGAITVDEIVIAVTHALMGCPGPLVAGRWMEDQFRLVSSSCSMTVTNALRGAVSGLPPCLIRITRTAPGRVRAVDCNDRSVDGTVAGTRITFDLPLQSATQGGCTISETNQLTIDASHTPTMAHYIDDLTFAGSCSMSGCTVVIESRWTRQQ